jgi:hypothetical protein
MAKYHGHRKARSFDIHRMPSSLYNRIVTTDVIAVLTSHFENREPFLIDCIFLYTPAEAKPQLLHRDVGDKLLAPAALLVDITSAPPTTVFIPGSHRDDQTQIDAIATEKVKEIREAVSCQCTHHNALLFNCCVLHHGSQSSVATCKLVLTFAAKPRTVDEEKAFVEHSYAFGISDANKSLTGKMLPLIPLQRSAN